MQPLILYTLQGSGPNPKKVGVLLEELGLPYEKRDISFENIKREPFISVNPNGRAPALEDPNTGITVWESCAIIMYLIDQYDKDHKLTFTTAPEKHHLRQWLFFQASGQGPPFGQTVHFSIYHPQLHQSAIDRFTDEVRRVVGVLDKWLETRNYLVGEKCTYADLAFVTWNELIGSFIMKNAGKEWNPQAEFKNFHRWQTSLEARQSVKAVQEKFQPIGGMPKGRQV